VTYKAEKVPCSRRHPKLRKEMPLECRKEKKERPQGLGERSERLLELLQA
jgi:hypothetical protein